MADQICFTAKSDCSSWQPNRFKKEKCVNCAHLFTDHKASNVANDQISDYLHELNAKNPCNEILPKDNSMGALFLGSFQALSDTNLKKYEISKGVQTAKDLESFFVGWGKKLAALEKEGKIELLRLHWVDGEGQKLWLNNEWDQISEAIQFIHDNRKNGENVLVNCAQGKSRSSTVVVGYLMVTQNMSFDEALVFTQSKRSIADPNEGFKAQLKDFGMSECFNDLKGKLC